MTSAVTSAVICIICAVLMGSFSVNGNTLVTRPPPSCATVMCSRPCPTGQYLVLNEYGCETCDCYDPCQDFPCETGECHWVFDENTRPLPFCVDCRGGQTWSDCTGGDECVATCANRTPMCNRNCYPGCQCPSETPILHHGQCVTEQQCQGTEKED